MFNTLLIFIGAGIGGVLRYWIANLVYLFTGNDFPYGTLIVNVSGCLLMGILFVMVMERMDSIAPQLRALLLIGVLGGYTTFSSFSIETINLIENGDWLKASLYILSSVIICLAATGIGVIGARQL